MIHNREVEMFQVNFYDLTLVFCILAKDISFAQLSNINLYRVYIKIQDTRLYTQIHEQYIFGIRLLYFNITIKNYIMNFISF